MSPAGADLLATLAAADLSESNTLTLVTALRRERSAEIASAALMIARQRQRAVEKFSRAGEMFFTPEALEQASGEIVSQWRARRFDGCRHIADLGCGAGGDTLALASFPGVTVVALDRDALRLRMARANLAVYGQTACMVRADLTDPLPLHGIQAAFFDPARRAESGRRMYSVHDYIPPLDVINEWDFRALAVKLSPGIDLDELHPYITRGAGVEFISLGGDLKEAVLWSGDLGFDGRWATRLEADGSGETVIPQHIPAPQLSAPRAYLYEPDPAIIRAGLLGELGLRLGVDFYRLDETIAYLTSDSYAASSWARAWPVWGWMPFHLKRLRAALRDRGIGQVTVKKRGSPITPEDLIRQLKLDGQGDEAVVVLTRIAGQHSAILCGPML